VLGAHFYNCSPGSQIKMAFVRPEEVVKSFGLEPGMAVADFGCGSGHYTIAAAKLVSETGTIYAIDVQKDLLEAVKSLAGINNLKNVEIIWADLEKLQGSRLDNDSVDFVIISNILFQAENRSQIAKEAFRILKNNGKIAVIEWLESFGGLGPRPEDIVSRDNCKKIFIKEGFVLDREFDPGEYHYGMIFHKT
jgi:ubiquinone/menaquinone biosynthesis C-methylase UbiE